ncbi:MAG: Asp23/Gls24 family envelope stress response protein [Lentisphaerae bacterium]|nr:Asp23/Gls24 family envelope stress response protein [Lentisphaerota bacterium]
MANVNRKVQNLSSNDGKAGGSIRVHESVVSSIVRKSVLNTEGVVRFAGNSFVDNIAEFVGSKAMQDRAISVEMGEGSVAISVQIVVQYGLYIPDVATKVQEAIQSQVQDLTGISVERVNVLVMDIERGESEDEEDDE